MSGRPAGTVGPGSGDGLAMWLIPAAAVLLLAGSCAAWAGGRVASAVTGHGLTGPTWRPLAVADLLHPSGSWPGVPVGLVVACTVVLLLLALTVVGAPVALVVQSARRSGQNLPLRSLARPRDVAALTPTAAMRRARQLRPSLPVKGRLPACQVGVPVGQLRPHGPALQASWEDVLLAVMAPRAGKTTALAVPAVLAAPGAVVATSNKADLWAATASLRAADTGEPVWVFDPQAIARTAQTWWWNPLAGVSTVEAAHRLAGHFVQEIRDGKGERDFWTSAAHGLLTDLLLAAGIGGRTLAEVYEWLADSTSLDPVDLLRAHGHGAAAASLSSRQNGAPETRDRIYETARTAAACLRDPTIMAWVTRPSRAGVTELDVDRIPTTRQSLYLLSKDGAGAAAPLVAALTDRVLRAGVLAAERAGGRLDPPLLAVLDEAANVCRIADLPDLYSHLGSRGIIPVTILQSYRQGVRVWGEPGMDALWSAATVKILGSGLDDARFAEDISRLVGDHDVTVRSRSTGDGRHTTSTSLRQQRILPAADIRALPKGTGLLLATGCRPAAVALPPWYAGRQADQISTALREAEQAVTTAAAAGRTR